MKEHFDRFKFALYKEKEMPEIRKWITALAGLALFAGLASAQVTGNGFSTGAFTCATTNASVTPTLRAEGYTEAVGDIVLAFLMVESVDRYAFLCRQRCDGLAEFLRHLSQHHWRRHRFPQLVPHEYRQPESGCQLAYIAVKVKTVEALHFPM